MFPDDRAPRRAGLADRPVDRAWAADLEAFLRGQLDGAPEPAEISDPVSAVLIAGYLRDRGLLGAATGMPPDEIAAVWRRSVEYTTTAFRGDPDGADHSLANSRRGLEAMELGLAAGAIEAVQHLALLVADAPDASYLGEGSVVCTPEQQSLAYTTRDLVLGRPDPGRWLRRTQLRTGERALYTGLLAALSRRDAADAAWLHTALHQAYRRRVLALPTRRHLDDCVDVVALATLVLARQCGLEWGAEPDPWLPLAVAGWSPRPGEVTR